MHKARNSGVFERQLAALRAGRPQDHCDHYGRYGRYGR